MKIDKEIDRKRGIEISRERSVIQRNKEMER